MSLTFFTDRDLGNRFPAVLRTAGISVEDHATHFRHDTPDDEWIPEVARRGWIGLTHDGRIRYKPNEKEAVFATRPFIARLYLPTPAEYRRDEAAKGRIEPWL